MKECWSKIWKRKELNRNSKCANEMKKDLEKLEEDSEANTDRNLLRVALKKIANWKTSGHAGAYEFWF